eukprot:jgi/Chrzof1/1964/Cz10g28050.t1
MQAAKALSVLNLFKGSLTCDISTSSHGAAFANCTSALMHRLQSSFECSTSSAQQQHIPAVWTAGASGWSSAAQQLQPTRSSTAAQLRAYARGVRQHRSRDSHSSRSNQDQPRLEEPKAPLGRVLASVRDLKQLPSAEPYYPIENIGLDRATFQDPDPEAVKPKQIDTQEDWVEYALFFREQIEKSSLPMELKRVIFSQPWEELLLDVHTTSRMTRQGRMRTMHATVFVGNFDGLVGLGSSSGTNSQQVMLDAYLRAYKNLIPIPRYRQHTIYHPIDKTYRKVRVQMWPRPDGFGVTANPVVSELCTLAGLRNLTVRITGHNKNRVNAVTAWLDALGTQSIPHDGVEGTGVYMREVYHKKLPYKLQRGVHVP